MAKVHDVSASATSQVYCSENVDSIENSKVKTMSQFQNDDQFNAINSLQGKARFINVCKSRRQCWLLSVGVQLDECHSGLGDLGSLICDGSVGSCTLYHHLRRCGRARLVCSYAFAGNVQDYRSKCKLVDNLALWKDSLWPVILALLQATQVDTVLLWLFITLAKHEL